MFIVCLHIHCSCCTAMAHAIHSNIWACFLCQLPSDIYCKPQYMFTRLLFEVSQNSTMHPLCCVDFQPPPPFSVYSLHFTRLAAYSESIFATYIIFLLISYVESCYAPAFKTFNPANETCALYLIALLGGPYLRVSFVWIIESCNYHLVPDSYLYSTAYTDSHFWQNHKPIFVCIFILQ